VARDSAGRWIVRAALLAGIAGLLHLTATGCIEEDTTQFGNPNTLSRQNLPGEAGAAPAVTSCAARFDGGCPSFDRHIYPSLTATGVWKCADPGCHGALIKPTIQCDTADQCYASLSAIQLDGKPYLSVGTDPSNARFLCSLQGTCGQKMPKPPAPDPTADDFCIIDAWLKCGSPR
jgi:hypothetical protein